MKAFLTRIPLFTSVLFGFSYASQLLRMWTERSAAGQSISGWIQVDVALVLFYFYYREVLPNLKLPRYCVLLESFMVLGIIGTTIYFRFII